MGDIADALIDQGLQELALHESGECDSLDPCPYCDEEEKNSEGIVK